ncbi:hypothetical protein [Streptomyces pseudogriseolus]|uniref:hypothetical protein n=1 Tax=Streptomyces pseudogriseolus TaxID=36817 RepID=UPI00368AE7A8
MSETVLAAFAGFIAAVGVASVIEMRHIRNLLKSRIEACRKRTHNYVFPTSDPLSDRQLGKLVVALKKDRRAVRGFHVATAFWYVGVLALLTCEVYILQLLADGDVIGGVIVAAISIGFVLLMLPPLIRNTHVAFQDHNFRKHRAMKALLKRQLRSG